MRLLCPGAYTWKNKGDAALVLAMLSELRRVFPTAQFTLLSDTPQLDTNKYGVPVFRQIFGNTLEGRPYSSTPFERFLDRHVSWRLPKSRRLRLLQELGQFYLFLLRARLTTWVLKSRCYMLFPRPQRTVARAFCDSDAVVFVPGGYLLAPHAGHTYWFRHLAALFLAAWLRKPIYFYACTVGPFHGWHNRWLARLALRKVNVVVLREKSSERAVSLLAPDIARFLTTDVAFLSPGCSTEQVQSLEAQWLQDARRPIVGISVRFYSFPGDSDAKGKAERYVEAMASCAQHLVTAHGATVYFVPQVLLDQLSDVVMARAVCSRIADKSFIRILEADLSPTELRGLYSCFDAFVGVRMHANIFALSECVPTLAIAYEPKTAGIMSLLGLSDYVLNIRQLEIGSLLDRVDLLMANRASLRRQLISAVVDARTIAARTADIIREQMQLRGVVTNAGSLK